MAGSLCKVVVDMYHAPSPFHLRNKDSCGFNHDKEFYQQDRGSEYFETHLKCLLSWGTDNQVRRTRLIEV